jgi:hypothetical protein
MKWGIKQVTFIFLTVMLAGAQTIDAQQASRKNLSTKHTAYYDSLLKMDYDRVFPILGDKVYKKGFDIPFPIGIMINNFYGKQDMELSNLRIGVKTPDTTLGPADFSEVIVFEKVNAEVYNINTRIDLWVLPFLNVYGLFMYIPYAQTEVVLSEPVQLTSKPEQSGWTWGFGVMGAGGVGPFWLQGDYNLTWSDMQLLNNKVFTQVVGIRLGQVFPSKVSPEKNVSFWIGAMGLFLNNETVGEVSLDEALPGIPQEKIDEIKQSYSEWYNGLSQTGQQVADKILQGLQDKINGRPTGDTYITYEMDKAPKSKWAGLVGAQYQFNKRWQLRGESNFIGKDRFSLLLSVNYRFLGFKKK